MKVVKFHPEAESEMVEAAKYYSMQQSELGVRFISSVQEAVNRIYLFPLLYPVMELDVRRSLVNTFPFGILFRVFPNMIVIIAVMHLNREPDYWKNRLATRKQH